VTVWGSHNDSISGGHINYPAHDSMNASVMKFIYSVAQSVLKPLSRILYKHQVYGLEHIPIGPAILAANHTSYLDVMLIGASCPDELHWLADEWLFRVKWLRSVIVALNAHSVSERGSRLGAIRQAGKVLAAGGKVALFPEGVRSRDGSIGDVRAGVGLLAARYDAPVVPTYVHGPHTIWNRDSMFPNLSGRTACVFGAPLVFKEQNHNPEAYQAFANQVKDALENLQQVYITTLSRHNDV